MNDKAVAVRSGNKTFLQDYVSKNPLNVGIYKIIPQSPIKPTHLEDFTDFSLPSKLYGESLDYLTNKVIKSFSEHNKSVGVLLSGLKGTGKSLQLKHIAVNANIPFLIVDTFIEGSELITFLEKIPTSCVVVFDEFEKVYYEEREQETILPLLDGLSSSPHIFVLTTNSKVSEFLIGRPSRIRYHKKYHGLDDSIIKEITDDLLIEKPRVEEVSNFLSMMDNVNMDMVVSFIQDINLFPDEQLEKIIKTFNIEDPMKGEFIVIFSTPGLVSLKTDIEAQDVKNRVREYMRDRYGVDKLNIMRQFYSKDILNENLGIMKEIVNKFTSEIAIKKITASVDIDDLNEFLKQLSRNETYLEKNYTPDEYFPEECYFECIHRTCVNCLNDVSIKKINNNTIQIFSEDRLIALCSKRRINSWM